jgi:hypothetical protein
MMNKIKLLKTIRIFAFFSIILLSAQEGSTAVNTRILGTYENQSGNVKIEFSSMRDFPYKVTIAIGTIRYTCNYEAVARLRSDGSMLECRHIEMDYDLNKYTYPGDCDVRILIRPEDNSLEVLDHCSPVCGLNGTIMGIFKRR